jgi:hypothetical protein
VIHLSRPFPSQLSDLPIPLIYSLVLIPGINLVPFLNLITLHILDNKSRRRHPGFWSSVEHPLRTIRFRISGTQTSDAESQNNSWLAGLGLPSTLLETRTSFLLVGLGCLVVINIIRHRHELALAPSKNPEYQEDDEWGFGQILTLLLVVPIREISCHRSSKFEGNSLNTTILKRSERGCFSKCDRHEPH